MKRLAARRVLVLALALAGPGVAAGDVEAVFDGGSTAVSRRRTIERSRRLLADVLELYPGSTVAVTLDDQLVWSAGFGYANASRQIPVTSTTQFRVDTVAEALTATALLKLAEEGRIDLDAPVQRYVPAFPEKAYPITPRLLAAHLAGLPAIPAERWTASRNCDKPEDAFRYFSNLPLSRIPGSRFLHSAAGYVLLSAVVANACGQDFISCLQEKVFRPAGMTATLPDDPRSPAPRSATPYERGWFGMLNVASATDTVCKWGAGGFISTAEDLARFGMALLRGELLRRESTTIMFSPQKTSSGESTGHGLGWQIGVTAGGRRRLVQSGRTAGGRSVLVLVPESRLTVAVLANVNGEHLDDHALKIADLFAEPD